MKTTSFRAAIGAILLGVAVASCGGGSDDKTATPAYLTALTPSVFATMAPGNQITPSQYLSVAVTLTNPSQTQAIACNPAAFTLVAGGVSQAAQAFSTCDTPQVAPQSNTTAHLYYGSYYAGKADYRLFWNGGFGFRGDSGESRDFSFDSGILGDGKAH